MSRLDSYCRFSHGDIVPSWSPFPRREWLHLLGHFSSDGHSIGSESQDWSVASVLGHSSVCNGYELKGFVSPLVPFFIVICCRNDNCMNWYIYLVEWYHGFFWNRLWSSIVNQFRNNVRKYIVAIYTSGNC